jgi:hypothetical protein
VADGTSLWEVVGVMHGNADLPAYGRRCAAAGAALGVAPRSSSAVLVTGAERDDDATGTRRPLMLGGDRLSCWVSCSHGAVAVAAEHVPTLDPDWAHSVHCHALVPQHRPATCV